MTGNISGHRKSLSVTGADGTKKADEVTTVTI
jgi:hypothetical protein